MGRLEGFVAGVLAAGLVACGTSAPPPDPVTVSTATIPRATPGATLIRPTAAPAASASPEPAVVRPPRAASANTPTALAAALVAAEQTIRDARAGPGALAAAGHEQQIAYRRLVRRQRWRAPVLARLPAALRPAARRNIAAGERLYELVTPQPKLPDWRIRRPAPAAELRRHYRRAGNRFAIPWQYLAAIHLVETRMGRIRGTSTAGAQGPMQFLPATWAVYGRGDINDNGDAIMAAARYLSANGAPQDMRRALWRYNHSDRYVDAISAYARTMVAEPRTYRGYYHWQVYYLTVDGDALLPVGYGR